MSFKMVVPLATIGMILCMVMPEPHAVTTPPPLVETVVPLKNYVSAQRWPDATYEWQTAPGSADPAEVRWIMVNRADHGDDYAQAEEYIRNNPDAPEWSPWQTYAPPTTGTSWTSSNLDWGHHVFAVHGRDINGNTDTEFVWWRNLKRITITPNTTGPGLFVTGDLIELISTAVTTTPVTEIDVPAGTPIIFCWEANADAMGLPVTGYRYSWDVLDPDNDDDWSMPFTPFSQETECSATKTFGFGTHVFYVEAIHYDGFKARAPIRITVTAPTPTEATTWGRIKSLYR